MGRKKIDIAPIPDKITRTVSAPLSDT
jgi:hypothetical protein